MSLFRSCLHICMLWICDIAQIPKHTSSSGCPAELMDVEFFHVSLSGQVYHSCNTIRKLKLPECESLTGQVFHSCKEMISVECPKCHTIQGQTFHSCRKLQYVSLPSCSSIGGQSFSSCKNITTFILTKYHSFSPFDDVTSIKYILAPMITYLSSSAIKDIGDSAFRECVSLKTLDLRGCQHIGANAFNGCRNLTRIDLDVCTNIGDQAFGSISTRLDSFYAPELSSFSSSILPDVESIESLNVHDISKDGFRENKKLEMIQQITCSSIGQSAFQNSALKTIERMTISECINASAFSFSELRRIGEIDKVKRIGESAFEGTRFENITIWEGIEEIGSKCFYGVEGARVIIESDGDGSLGKIGEQAFGEGKFELINLGKECSTRLTISNECFMNSEIGELVLPRGWKLQGRSLYGSNITNLRVSGQIRGDTIEALNHGGFIKTITGNAGEVCVKSGALEILEKAGTTVNVGSVCFGTMEFTIGFDEMIDLIDFALASFLFQFFSY